MEILRRHPNRAGRVVEILAKLQEALPELVDADRMTTSTTRCWPASSTSLPQVAVGSIRKTGWSAGSGSSCMERRQLQVIVLA
jgi:hypothetical protein